MLANHSKGRWSAAGAVAIIATLATGIGTVPARAAGSALGHPRSVHFTAPFDDQGTHIGPGSCVATQPGVCSLNVHGNQGRFSGALRTVVDYHGEAHLDAITTRLHVETWDHHVGSLAGCGGGSFVMHQTDFDLSIGLDSFDPANRGYRYTLKWQIEKGTGAFAGATGSGTAVGYITSVGFDGETYLPNHGTYTGTITCPAGR